MKNKSTRKKKNNAWENVWVNPSLRMGMILTHLPMTLHGLCRTCI
eukprot:SAG11_NODE_2492_length_3292_cov_2.280301_2_plen_45_part_00